METCWRGIKAPTTRPAACLGYFCPKRLGLAAGIMTASLVAITRFRLLTPPCFPQNARYINIKLHVNMLQWWYTKFWPKILKGENRENSFTVSRVKGGSDLLWNGNQTQKCPATEFCLETWKAKLPTPTRTRTLVTSHPTPPLEVLLKPVGWNPLVYTCIHWKLLFHWFTLICLSVVSPPPGASASHSVIK